MSCITELLKMKDKPLLNKKGSPLLFIEGGGIYKDHEYLITFTNMGHRCGYVALHSDSKYNSIEEDDYDKLDISVHGGITFISNNHGLKSMLKTPCTDMWIGFDCGHAWDLKDKETFLKYFGENHKNLNFIDSMNEISSLRDYKLRDFIYTENECKSIIDQLIGMQ